jgi:hypothetical protein
MMPKHPLVVVELIPDRRSAQDLTAEVGRKMRHLGLEDTDAAVASLERQPTYEEFMTALKELVTVVELPKPEAES